MKPNDPKKPRRPHYPGTCYQYGLSGPFNVAAVCAAIPIPFFVGLACLQNGVDFSTGTIINGLSNAIGYGCLGYVAAHFAQAPIARQLAKRKVGITRGCRLMKWGQGAVYGAAVSAGLAFTAATGAATPPTIENAMPTEFAPVKTDAPKGAQSFMLKLKSAA